MGEPCADTHHRWMFRHYPEFTICQREPWVVSFLGAGACRNDPIAVSRRSGWQSLGPYLFDKKHRHCLCDPVSDVPFA